MVTSEILNLSSIFCGFAYAYDKEDNKKYGKRVHTTKGDAYNYDSIYRLIGVKYGVANSTLNPASSYASYGTYDSEETFDLDGVGNRNSVTHGTTVNYTPNNLNQYEQIDGQTLDYDDNGNLIDDGINTYVYDYANRLLSVIRKSDSKVLGEYKYDALGRRFYKKGWDGSQYIETYFYYDGVRCIEERNASDTMIAQYVFGNGIDEVLTMDRNSETYYYHENSLGSIYAVTTGTGGVAERYSYDAYGNVTFMDANYNTIPQSAIGNDYLFTGRRYDPETGLYFYRARYYSAEMGRFVNRDPVGYNDLFNLYTYVRNNPLYFIDPFGLKGIGFNLKNLYMEAGKKIGVSDPELFGEVMDRLTKELTDDNDLIRSLLDPKLGVCDTRLTPPNTLQLWGDVQTRKGLGLWGDVDWSLDLSGSIDFKEGGHIEATVDANAAWFASLKMGSLVAPAGIGIAAARGEGSATIDFTRLALTDVRYGLFDIGAYLSVWGRWSAWAKYRFKAEGELLQVEAVSGGKVGQTAETKYKGVYERQFGDNLKIKPALKLTEGKTTIELKIELKF
ncbi:RHS repeat-associated core domain-containing protein [Planctomycetota bacterium]